MSKSTALARKSRGHPAVSRDELLVDGSDELFQHFVHGIVALSERWNTVRAGFGEYVELSGIQHTILMSIVHLQKTENVSVRRIADHLHLSGAFVTSVTGQLEKADLIRKQRDTTDRRKVRLGVTPKGKSLLKKLAPTQQQINDEMFACLSRSDFQSLAKLVDDMILCADRAITLQQHLNHKSS